MSREELGSVTLLRETAQYNPLNHGSVPQRSGYPKHARNWPKRDNSQTNRCVQNPSRPCKIQPLHQISITFPSHSHLQNPWHDMARHGPHRVKRLHLQQLRGPLPQRRGVAQRQRAALAAEQRHGDGDHGGWQRG